MVVTSYEILLSDIKFMAKYQWKYIVVDEVRQTLVSCSCKPGQIKWLFWLQCWDSAGRRQTVAMTSQPIATFCNTCSTGPPPEQHELQADAGACYLPLLTSG